MKTLRNWWQSKTNHRKQNWFLLSLGVLFVASGFIESGHFIALIALVPTIGMVYLECTCDA
jgi:hypothetical protein